MVILKLIGCIVGVGTVLYVHHRLTERQQKTSSPRLSLPDNEDVPPEKSEDAECCGQHAVCEKDSLLSAVSENIEYYDDEELDRFRGRDPMSYLAAEEDEFREVLLTMRADEVAGWARSLTLRGVELPAAVREELLLIVAEQRESKSQTSN